ncbi:anthranilate phosphoribosyltransferase [Rhodospirillaceae bacterium AH-315-P19]|nr:anthranilate phosphoribosyltransferase [Rhodospirillaceae bacterium AH-315-P19]
MAKRKSVLHPLLAKIATGKTLDAKEASAAFRALMTGAATPAEIGAFLMGLRVRGETVEEITAAARVLRARALSIQAPAGAIDTCGTGGDASGTLNVSTAAALVVAGAGVPVAKHGNRALSSKCGSADVLEALGVNLTTTPGRIRQAFRQAKIGFLFAPHHHQAMRHVAETRKQLGMRTIFNLLGPLANPAGARRQLLGVYSPDWVVPMARVLKKLGTTRAWVVHGKDGLDELTTTTTSFVASLASGRVRSFEVAPEDAGLPRARPEMLKGGNARTNARAIERLLEGKTGPFRDIVLLNAAAALIVAEKARNLKQGVTLAAQAIDSGQAQASLRKLVEITNAGKDA